jgi:L-alanine-DL-glutamate epimerase-like enolase superfamily enzyme
MGRTRFVRPARPWFNAAMSRATDVHVVGTRLYFLPVQTRMPLKFGPESVTSVTCARAAVTVMDDAGHTAIGWGETPLSVQWVWPSSAPYEPRHRAIKEFSTLIAQALAGLRIAGHPIEIGHHFIEHSLSDLRTRFNLDRAALDRLPYLAALVAFSPFDIALHDAYGQLHGLDVYATYGEDFLGRDLSAFLTPSLGAEVTFRERHPADYLVETPPQRLIAWHLVGGLDPLEEADLTGREPRDDYPVLLRDWIRRDGLKCLKVKLRGDEAEWDCDRLVRVGRIAIEENVHWLSADFNCTVTDPGYVNDILDVLRDAEPRVYGMILYVEQPFPYDLQMHRIDVRSVTARKPLFLDESAHDWKYIRLGRDLGWSGVALKTCKTQTGALLSLCWAKAHGMPLMVQDLTNPMLAQIPHVRLAAHADTIMGVETNAMQFYPQASAPEAAVHRGLYQRAAGHVDLSTLAGPGFGYRLAEISRDLPKPAGIFE